MQNAGAGVAPTADEACGAGQASHGLHVECFDRRPAPPPLLGARRQKGDVEALDARLYPAGALRAAVDLQPVDERERRIGDGAGESRGRLAEATVERVRVKFQSGDDLPAVASAGPEADLARLQNDDRSAAFGQRQRRRQSGIAGPDNGDIGARGAFQRRRLRRDQSRRGVPERAHRCSQRSRQLGRAPANGSAVAS